MFDRNDVLADLRDNVAEVTFRKVDGTPRSMKVTLMREMLPANYNSDHLREMHLKPENLQTIVCWDLDARAWKSFRVDSVEIVQILPNY